jgi:hypothetical protein
MAGYHGAVDRDYRDRDVIFMTVLVQSYTSLAAITPANCQNAILSWARSHNELYPILCDTDLDNNGQGDVITQLWHVDDPATGGAGEPADADWECGGTPQSFLVDQGNVMYGFLCGAYDALQPYYDMVSSEANPETCE